MMVREQVIRARAAMAIRTITATRAARVAPPVTRAATPAERMVVRTVMEARPITMADKSTLVETTAAATPGITTAAAISAVAEAALLLAAVVAVVWGQAGAVMAAP